MTFKPRRRRVSVAAVLKFAPLRVGAAATAGVLLAASAPTAPPVHAAPGNVAVPASRSGLPKDSVVNVSQIVTLDKRQLGELVGSLDHDTLAQIDAGIRLVLDLVG